MREACVLLAWRSRSTTIQWYIHLTLSVSLRLRALDSSAHVEWEVRSGTTVFFMSLTLDSPFLYCVFLEPCTSFFSGCELWRGASLSLLTLATQGLTKLREKKIPAFHCMNRSPAASPLGEAQQWLHFKNGQTGRVCWPETAQDPSGDLKQSDKENKGAKLHWHHYGKISVEEKFYCQ